PEDSDQLMYYREDQQGQVLQEGINEAGAMSSWIAAASAYSNHGVNMIPFYIFYSMFGFQRVGDLAWAAGDIQARGFLIGGTAGRTTLAGEGLQHQDGHSHVIAATIPNCIAYDPTFSYELAVIIQDGLRRMYQDGESVYYYITCENENYTHPAMPQGAEQGILRGMYRLREIDGANDEKHKVSLLGCGSILREVVKAGELLAQDWNVGSQIWSVTSFSELARDGRAAQRHNILNPEDETQTSYVEQCLQDSLGPVIAATDYIAMHSEQIRPFVPKRYVTLGTDGFGRSDTRAKLREFFEVNAQHITVATLNTLADDGVIPKSTVSEALNKYNIDSNKPNPAKV
ncbi:MAG: pyruvate dehydrogenase (acetyl-transferring), homodimeric type, partial [Gammaproteobacteria bacterium]|nr:pyruvate dehydrogenase (acetyl-transferring), homodimeric type [Gammaproteobacteria bacterium]